MKVPQRGPAGAATVGWDSTIDVLLSSVFLSAPFKRTEKWVGHNPRSRLPFDRRCRVLKRRYRHATATFFQKSYRSLDLRAHRAGREMPLGQIALHLRQLHLIQMLFLVGPVIDRDAIDIR